MPEKQNSNSRCSQLKLDWKTWQGTVEQPQLPTSYWRNLPPTAYGSTVDPRATPWQVPKANTPYAECFLHQTSPRAWFAKCCTRTEHRPQHSWNARLFLGKIVPAHSASHLLGCSAPGEKSCKNQFAPRQKQLKQLKPSKTPYSQHVQK